MLGMGALLRDGRGEQGPLRHDLNGLDTKDSDGLPGEGAVRPGTPLLHRYEREGARQRGDTAC